MWWDTNFTFIWLFYTERGLSITIRLPDNIGIIYDLGCSEEFSPTIFIKENIIPHLNKNASYDIGQIILSHPHTDHIQEIDALLPDEEGNQSPINPRLITCPNDIIEGEKIDFSRIENEDNKEFLNKYKMSYKGRNPPLQTLQSTMNPYPAPNVEYGLYYVLPSKVEEIYPEDDQLYGNGLSLVLYLRHGHQTLLIPGDITPEILIEILNDASSVQKRYTYFSNKPIGLSANLHLVNCDQPSLGDLLCERGLSILITPHHGLESCYCSELFEVIKDKKTKLNIISEKRHLSDTDGQVANQYQSEKYSSGLNIDIDGTSEKHFSVSTRNGHHILIVFKGTTAVPLVYLRTDPNDLLDIF